MADTWAASGADEFMEKRAIYDGNVNGDVEERSAILLDTWVTDNEWATWDELENAIWLDGAHPQGSNEWPTKADVAAHAVQPVPQNVQATHDQAPCPDRQVVVDYDIPFGKEGQTQRWEHSTDGVNWTAIFTALAAGSVTFRHDNENGGPAVGNNEYRGRFADEVAFSTPAVVNVVCPI